MELHRNPTLLQIKQQTFEALKGQIFENITLTRQAKVLGISKQLLCFRMNQLSNMAMGSIYEDLYNIWSDRKNELSDLDKIKTRRKLLRISQTELANKVNVSKSTIAHIETGRLRLQDNLKYNLFKVLEII